MGKIIKLTSKTCVPCEGGIPPLSRERALDLAGQIPLWRMDGEARSISRDFRFKDFKGAMDFVEKVAKLAESEGHHPDIHISYDKVRLELSTHAIGGLSENDFILAAKTDQLAEPKQP